MTGRNEYPELAPAGEWVEHAACAQEDKDLFFPARGDTKAVRAAKAVCATCPVCAECLNYALVNREDVGVWGGKSNNERRQIRYGKAS